MLEHDDTWELAPENAHPRARELLTDPFFWSIVDDDAPLGNDTGADTLAFYRQWRSEHPTKSVQVFITDILSGWEVENADWLLLDETQLRQALDEEHFSILTRDDFMIALAFAQLVLEGRVEPEIREMAHHCVRRQATDAVISFRGWTDATERRSRLAQMQRVLESV
jgi:uncharacterized protein YfeS